MNTKRIIELFEDTMDYYIEVNDKIKDTTDNKDIIKLNKMGGLSTYMEGFRKNEGKVIYEIIKESESMEQLKKNIDLWSENKEAKMQLKNVQKKLSILRNVMKIMRKATKLNDEFRANFKQVFFENLEKNYEDN